MIHTFLVATLVLSIVARPVAMTQTAAGTTPTLACTFQRGGGVADGPALNFETVADRAVAIVVATAQTVTPVPTPAAAVRHTAVSLVANQVLKGPDTLREFATSQIGAIGLFEFKPGQRYILFLNNRDPRAPEIFPDRPGIPRFESVSQATMCVQDNVVYVSEHGNFLRARFNGIDLEKAVAEVRSYVNR